MLLNYLKIAFRNIKRFASYAIINISGLTLGITCALLIFSLVNYHLSFDDFHYNSERIYRFVTEQHRDEVSYTGSVPPAFGKTFRDDYSYGEQVARICTADEAVITVEHNGNTKKFKEEVSFADPEFFRIFNFPLLTGQKDALSNINTAIITERMAKKYFGDESALDKTFRFDNKIDFKITGILKDIPENTSFRSEIYLSYSNIGQHSLWLAADDAWGGIVSDLQTFVLLHEGTVPAEVESVLPAYVKKYRAQSKNVHHYKLQPLSDVHFNPNYGGRMSETTILILSVIGFFLVFTACLNFINLATAQAFHRSREVGVRKALGSARTQLFWQFTSETGVIVIAGLLLALCVVYTVLPYVNVLFGTRISLQLFLDLRFVLFTLALVVAVTFLAGAYPGLILSGFKPVQALKAKLSDQGTGNFNLRRVLIITQFTISQVLLIGLIVIMQQMRYFRETDMGFNRDGVVMVPAASNDVKLNTFKNELLKIPQVKNASLCFSAPASDSQWGTSLTYDNRTEMEVFSVSFKGADENYLSTFGIDLIAGRNLTPSDTAREFVVNETLVSKLGLSSPEDILGKIIAINGSRMKGPVVGVVSDFHDQSLHSAISPVAITTMLEYYNECAVKIDMTNASETLASLEKTWSNLYPEQIYDYDFLDEQTAELYQREETTLQLIQVFAFIALVIGCMGLYGLVSFMAVRKTKEIGIRKVLGGSVTHILWIFGKEFAVLLGIAFALAAPAGGLLMSRWLENYEYHIEMSAGIFITELVIISVIVLLTVGFKSANAALRNPVQSLRTE